MTMFSFLLNEEECSACGVNLIGEGMVKVGHDLYSVNEGGRIVENISAEGYSNDTDLILDHKTPIVTCKCCGNELDYSYNREE